MIEEKRTDPLPPNPPDRSRGIQLNPGSEWAKELQKFEQWPTASAPRPGNPYQYRPFPKMVYKADKFNGKIASHAVVGPQWEYKDADEYRRQEESAAKFTESCQRIVKDERELQKAYEEGYRGDPVEAVEYLKAKDRAISTATAERHYADQKMSEAAQREAAAADAASDEHVPEVPEKPRKRGRPKGSRNVPKV